MAKSAATPSQKNHLSVYLTAAYADPRVEQAIKAGFEKAGKKLDMGKSCIRFRDADDLPLDVIGKAVAAIPPAAFNPAVRGGTRARERGTQGGREEEQHEGEVMMVSRFRPAAEGGPTLP